MRIFVPSINAHQKVPSAEDVQRDSSFNTSYPIPRTETSDQNGSY